VLPVKTVASCAYWWVRHRHQSRRNNSSSCGCDYLGSWPGRQCGDRNFLPQSARRAQRLGDVLTGALHVRCVSKQKAQEARREVSPVRRTGKRSYELRSARGAKTCLQRARLRPAGLLLVRCEFRIHAMKVRSSEVGSRQSHLSRKWLRTYLGEPQLRCLPQTSCPLEILLPAGLCRMY
jgi:hypothetical protein